MGVPALAGTLGQGAPDPALVIPRAGGSGHPAAAPTPSHSTSAPAIPIPAWWRFVTPVVPAQQLTGDLVPVTAQSAELLLLDELPAGATPSVSSQAATTGDAGLTSGQVDVTTSHGSGTVLVNMTRPGAPALSSCASQDSGPEPANLACRTFSLAGGVTVQETLLSTGSSPSGGTRRYIVAVAVRRADGLQVTIEAASFPFDSRTEKGEPTGLPLTVRQIVTAAADPRWAWQMPSSFVAQAGSVQLPGATPKG